MKTIRKFLPVLFILLFVVSLFLIFTANKEPEGIANQMKQYYLNDTEPEGNTFYHYNISSTSLPETDEKGQCKFIKLPLYRQSHNFTCGLACVASVLRNAG